MLTVPQAARRTRRHAETIRRWIREGRLPAKKIGTQHFIEERDLDALSAQAALPTRPEWSRASWGGPMPDWVSIIARLRARR